MRILLDTGPLVALLNRRDAFHRWAVSEASKLDAPFYSCEAVVAEAFHLLKGIYAGRERLTELLASGRNDISFAYADHIHRVGELMESYADVHMDFADACLVCLLEENEGRVFTIDNDFRDYRLHGSEIIDAILP